MIITEQKIFDIIKEEMGVSQHAEDILEKLKNNARLDLRLDQVNYDLPIAHCIDDKTDGYVALELAPTTKTHSMTDYPITDGSIRQGKLITPRATIRLAVHIDYIRDGHTLEDLFNNDSFNATIIHELHHFITNYKTGFIDGKQFYEQERAHPFISTLQTHGKEASNELKNFYYYLGKAELNSIIPELKYSKRNKILDLFKKFRGMSFEEFSRYIQENNCGRVPTKKEYNAVQDRIN